MLVALVALSMVACKKDGDLITPTNTQKKTAVTSSHNHITAAARKSCASTQYMAQKLENPTYRAAYESATALFERNIKSRTAQSRSACTTPTVLPIAIHYQGVTNPDKACLIKTAKEAVAVLNADFQGKNSDIVQWTNNAASTYPGLSFGEACLEFKLGSKNHPAGFGLSDGDLAITINKTTEVDNSDWTGYINIVVGDAEGSLGFSPLGGSGTGDGMMIAQGAFAIGTGCSNISSQSPNDLGRTLTHEMGHYLNLDHIWGEGCGTDDLVNDTPSQEGPNYGCPTLGGTKSCNTEDLHMNYMDYADDACMYMFSAGQASRMESWVTSGLLENLKKGADVFGDVTGGDNTGGGDDNTDGGEETDDNTDGGDGTDGGDNTDDSNDDDDSEETNDGDDTEDEGDYDDEDYDDEGDYDEEEEGEEGTEEDAISTISIQVRLDNYGSETTFEIEDAYGDVIATYGPYEDGQEGTVITEAIDLPTGVYTYVIYDAYGDGICCDEGDGKWKLFKDDAELMASNGNFGDWEAFDFTVGYARLSAPAHRIDQKDANLVRKQKAAIKLAVKQ